MGLHVSIYRNDYDSGLNVFHGRRAVTVTNVAGPFDPTSDAPAARLDRGPGGDLVIVPEHAPADMAGPMFGGTFATTSDSRFREVTGTRAAIPVHDRYESWDLVRANYD